MNKNKNKKIYWKCKTCGDEIFFDTKKVMTWCSCGAMGIDGCQEYTRIIGDSENAVQIKK
jgi:predicted RNA-binding Zn-ribbon protein involved in translation (DUF1610 family)